MARFGFVGLPNAGKSSLYNALAGGGAHAAPYPFATTDPNVGVAKVPDDRLDRLAVMSKSRKVVHASIQFTDIGGLVDGASRGEGLGNAFLSHIREVDAIVFVLRAFPDRDVPGSTDPLEHLRVLEIELALADLATVERQIEKHERGIKGDPTAKRSLEILEKSAAVLGAGTPLYRASLSSDDKTALRPFFLLTDKPVLVVLNIGEDQLGHDAELAAPIRAELAGADVVPLCVQLEAEAALLDAAERDEMLEGLGLGEGAVARFLRAAYQVLGLRTFFTTRENESRAWPFKAGSTAPECAGAIHSDFQRGFIRAETIQWDELLTAGSWTAARERGMVRSEGKDYVVADGDVMEIRFNV